MKQRLILLMLTGAVWANAQTAVYWSAMTPTTPWGTGVGFLSIANTFDPVSGTTVYYGLRQFAGTVSVTNGSGVVTWVSGDKFSVIWHAPNQVKINGTGQNILTGTAPGGCAAGIALSCTTLTVSNTSWTTACNAGCTYAFYAEATDNIYGQDIMFYNASTNTVINGPGWGAIDNMCLPDDNPYNLPDMRQNSGMMAVDTKRNRFYLMGGVNQSCRWSGITTNGTSTVTLPGTKSFGFFTQAGLFDGKTIQIPIAGTSYTVVSVTDEKTLTINCGGGAPACPNGQTTAILFPPERDPNRQKNAIYDMWYLTLNQNPTADKWVRVSVPMLNIPHNNIEGTLAYDSNDDLLLVFGQPDGGSNGQNTWVYCSTEGNPGGTLTSKQTAAGCVANDWAEVRSGGSSIPGPPGVYYPSLFYDPVNLVFWQYGGSSGYSAGNWQRDIWKYTPSTKTWVAMSSANQPPASGSGSLFTKMPEMSRVASGRLFWHRPDGPADYLYDPATNAWTTMASSGSSIPTCIAGSGTACPMGVMTVYDPTVNRIIAISQNYTSHVGADPRSNVGIWQGQITNTLNVPLKIRRMDFPGSLTGKGTTTPSGGISATNEYFSASAPIADTDGITDTSKLTLAGATAGQFRILGRWPSGNAMWIETLGKLSSLGADAEATVTLTNTGAGDFGAVPNMTTLAGGTITINTTGGTCGAGSAICFTMLAGSGFNGIDTMSIGATSLVSTGTSSGFVIQGPANPATDCGTATPCNVTYGSKYDSASTCVVEKDGPVEAVVKCSWTYKNSTGLNSYMAGDARFYFHAGSPDVRVTRVLKNATYGTSNTFATAFKGLQAEEFRMGSALSGTTTYTIGNHTSTNSSVGTPTTGTISGSDSVYVYQGQSTYLGDNTWDNCASPCTAFTLDQGYGIVKTTGGTPSTLQSGTNAQPPAGYADISDSGGAGITLGSFMFASSGPKSLEFWTGGGGTDAVRVGLFSGQNSYPVHIAWPQWYTEEFYVSFHASAATPLTSILKQQHPLIGRSTIAQYNSSGVFFWPIVDPVEEDTFLRAVTLGGSFGPFTLPASNPSVAVTKGCVNGVFDGAGHGCIVDVGTLNSDFPLYIFSNTGYTFSQGGGRNQIDWRYSWLTNYISRGYTGRFLGVKNFWMKNTGLMNAHSDFAGGWRGKTSAELDTQGRPNASSSQPTGTVSIAVSGGTATLTVISGAYFSPWMRSAGSGSITVNGAGNYAVASVVSPTVMTVSAGTLTTTGSATWQYRIAPGRTFLRSWSIGNGQPDEEHRHWWSVEDYYFMSGDETIKDSIRNVFDDFYFNGYTCQGAAQCAASANSGNGSTSATTGLLTITTGSMPSFVTVGYPVAVVSGINTVVYNITSITGASIGLTPTPPTLTGIKWAVVAGSFNTRAIGALITNEARYSRFLGAIGDPAGAATALTAAKNTYAMQVKPPLCASGYPAGCLIGATLSTTNRYTQGVSRERGVHNGARDGVDISSCSATNQRAGGSFQEPIMIQGLLELRAVAGPTWSDYQTASDLAYGMANWELTEGANYDGTNVWCLGGNLATCWNAAGTNAGSGLGYLGNGLRDYTRIDVPNDSCDATYFPVLGTNAFYFAFLQKHAYEGSTSWLPLLQQAMTAMIYGSPVGVGQTAHSIDWGGYQLQALIDHIARPGLNALQTQPFTFTNNGGGSYTLGWTNPTGNAATKLRWGNKQIVDWIGFNPVTNAFTGDAVATQNWFASTELSGAASAPGTASVTYTGMPTGLTAGNFMVKTLSPAGCGITTAPAVIGPYTNTQTVSITATAQNCGSGTLTWSSASLPTGLSGCSGVTGVSCTISGTLSAAGTFSATLGVTDGGGNTASLTPTVTVNAVPSISTSGSLPAATRFSPYSQALTTSGGTGSLTCAVVSGALPAGLSFTGCTISGSPTTSGVTTFTARATDSAGVAGSASASILITVNANAVCQISTASLPAATVGIAYSQQLAQSQCSASTWGGWATCKGLSLSTSGLLSGTPTSAGTCSGTITYDTASKALSITVNPAPGAGASSYGGTLTGIYK